MLPVILLTDFGATDPYVGQVKGVLHRLVPEVRILDLFHELPPYDLVSGAWFISRTRRIMPAPAVWLCVVDPGVGSCRRGLVVAHQGSFFVGPDNGLLSPVLAGAQVWRIDALPAAMHQGHLAGASPGATFHGRDIFAPVAAFLVREEGLAGGTEVIVDPVVLPWQGWGAMGEGVWSARVMLVDRYGNLITGLPGEVLPQGRIRGSVGGEPCGFLAHTFSSVPVGEKAMVIGGFGTLEVVINQGNAAACHRAGVGDEIRVWQEG